MLSKFKIGLVDDWRQCWKWASVQLTGLLFVVNLVAQAMPVLDPNIVALLPPYLRGPAPGVFALLLFIARVTERKVNG